MCLSLFFLRAPECRALDVDYFGGFCGMMERRVVSSQQRKNVSRSGELKRARSVFE